MPFTLLMLLGPFLLLGFAGPDPEFRTVARIGFIWLLLDVPILGVYWTARIVRRAWRDGTPRAAN